MPRFHLKQSRRHLTSHAGLVLVGQCAEAAQLDHLDSRYPTAKGLRTSDIVKSYLGLLSLGKSDFEAIEAFRDEPFFRQAMNVQKVPSSVWLRQRLERLAEGPSTGVGLRDVLAEQSVTLLQRTEAPITAYQGFVNVDFDTFVMDNSGTKKEHVSRTYQGVDGYTPIAAYLGNEGWCLGLELRPGSQHSALETHYFLERGCRACGRWLPPISRCWRVPTAASIPHGCCFKRGVAIFAKACFGHPSPSKQQKLNATAMAFGAPDVLLPSFYTQQGV